MADLILSMDLDEYFIGMGSLLFGVVWCFFASFRYLRHVRLMEDIPTSVVRSAPQGYVELAGMGKMMEGPPIIAPLSGTHCLWWRYEVEKHVQSGKRSRWKTIESGTSDNLFFLEDATGQCVVDPDGAQVIHSQRNVWYGNSPRPTKGPKVSGIMGNYRYTETLVMIGDPIYTLGEFRSDRGPSLTELRESAIRELVMSWKSDAGKMEIFDVNKDGTIDAREWEAAHRAAAAQVRRAEIGTSPSDAIHIISRPADRAYPYIISTQDQAKLVPKWKLFAALSFTGFLTGGSFFIYVWLIRPPFQILIG